MVKDYFSDIEREETLSNKDGVDEQRSSAAAEKSIRNISVSSRRSAMMSRMNPETRARESTPRARSRGFRIVAWGVAGVAVLIIGLLLFALLLSKTTIDITPRTHRITFDPTTQFTAYTANNLPGGGIVYEVASFDIDDAETVAATGSEKAEERASGQIMVYNAYSTSGVRLIKNTRFESPSGLVFRIPASVEIPGKKGSAPGEMTITVFADQPGPNYNIGATEKFTLPGLKGTSDMFNNVYARSTAAFSGGFSGVKPAIAPPALDSARAAIRDRLEAKIQEKIATLDAGFAFPGLANVAYESLPTVADPAGGAKVSERAHVQIPVFPRDLFAKSIAQAVSADAADSKVSLLPKDGFSAQFTGQAPELLGSTPLVFTLTGSALIVWNVDSNAIRDALLGKDQSAFKPVVATFLGIKDAQAHIAPMWSSHFPSDPSSIEIIVADPPQSE